MPSQFNDSVEPPTPPQEEPPTPPPQKEPTPPKKRDYSYLANSRKNRKCVVATSLLTEEKTYFYSMYATQKRLGINAGIIKACCDGKGYAKTGRSKVNGQQYEFAYFKEEELPAGYVMMKSKWCEISKKLFFDIYWEKKCLKNI